MFFFLPPLFPSGFFASPRYEHLCNLRQAFTSVPKSGSSFSFSFFFSSSPSFPYFFQLVCSAGSVKPFLYRDFFPSPSLLFPFPPPLFNSRPNRLTAQRLFPPFFFSHVPRKNWQECFERTVEQSPPFSSRRKTTPCGNDSDAH